MRFVWESICLKFDLSFFGGKLRFMLLLEYSLNQIFYFKGAWKALEIYSFFKTPWILLEHSIQVKTIIRRQFQKINNETYSEKDNFVKRNIRVTYTRINMIIVIMYIFVYLARLLGFTRWSFLEYVLFFMFKWNGWVCRKRAEDDSHSFRVIAIGQ